MKHGMSRTLTYFTWENMVKRCHNLKHKNYPDYGGRGITVCDKWRDFSGFYEDMGKKPINLSLDRIDNDKGYYKENCRWVTRTTQSHNQRHLHTTNTSGYRGVSRLKNRKLYIAYIKSDNLFHYLGYYKNINKAALAYDCAAIQLHGDEANLNIIGLRNNKRVLQ